MYFIPICDFDNDEPIQSIEREDSTARNLVNTQRFNQEHVRNPEHDGFEPIDIKLRATSILQVQAYELYQWCILRARIEHPTKLKKIHFACSKVMPWNFEVEEDDIQLYLQNPQFLWRFSMNNYEYFYKLFTKSTDDKKRRIRMKKFDIVEFNLGDELLTYDEDKSQVVPYFIPPLESFESLIRNKLGKSIRECSKWYRFYDFKEMLKDVSYYPLSDEEKTEFKSSYDYYLHLIEPDMSYDTFVRIIITGHTMNDAGPFLKMALEKKENLMLEEDKYKKVKEKHSLKKRCRLFKNRKKDEMLMESG